MASLIHAKGILRQDVYAASQRAYILLRVPLTRHRPGCVRRLSASLHTGRVCVSRIIVTAYLDSILVTNQDVYAAYSEPTYWSCMY